MDQKELQPSLARRLARRLFLGRLAAGAGVIGAAVAGTTAVIAKPAAAAPGDQPFHPTRHAQDDWLELPGQHRMVFDTTSADGMFWGLRFANEFLYREPRSLRPER